MRERKILLLPLSIAVALALGFGGASLAGEKGTWTGEVVDISCYKSRDAHGPDHAECAARCVKNGQPMGLLTDDGTLVLLKAAADDAPYEALKNLAGKAATVTGSLAEKDGMKVVTVTGSKAA